MELVAVLCVLIPIVNYVLLEQVYVVHVCKDIMKSAMVVVHVCKTVKSVLQQPYVLNVMISIPVIIQNVT